MANRPPPPPPSLSPSLPPTRTRSCDRLRALQISNDVYVCMYTHTHTHKHTHTHTHTQIKSAADQQQCSGDGACRQRIRSSQNCYTRTRCGQGVLHTHRHGRDARKRYTSHTQQTSSHTHRHPPTSVPHSPTYIFVGTFFF
jgi:hypothetical protein